MSAGQSPSDVRDELINWATDSRRRLLSMVSDLDDSQVLVPKGANVNPPMWEIGHVAWFQEKWILRNLDGRRSLLRDADALYDSFEVFHDWRWDLALPDRRETKQYLDSVLEACVERLSSMALSERENYFYRMTTFHEDMHSEALAYTRQALRYPAPPLFAIIPNEQVHPSLIGKDVEIPGGVFYLGADPKADFVFDNEKWAHPVEIQPFRIAATATTNAEFQAFVDDGGYNNRDFWDIGGWAWRQRTGVDCPRYWDRNADGTWSCWNFDQLTPIIPDHPVMHINWYEATAFCAWAHRRLPTEAEWEMAASSEVHSGNAGKRLYPWGNTAPRQEHANLDGINRGVIDVNGSPQGDSAFGCRQMLGNVWEWVEDRFWPFPGFVLDPYKEYSAPWFGDRRVLRGGCWATRSRLVRNTWRNFFTPDRNDIFSGFRTCAL